MPAATGRPLRADAERNRRRILDAAATLFAERGLNVSMEDVAAGAGVGVGTLYRRFADREALVDALFENKIGEMAQLARDALEIDDPWEAFASYFRAACQKQSEDRGLREAMLSSGRGRERVALARDTMRPLVGRLVARAQAAGELRADIVTLDIPMLQFCVGHIADSSRASAPEYYERVVTLLLDGLRARGDATPMSALPLTIEQFQRALACPR